MAIENLEIIGESINDSVPSTKNLFEAGDVEGLKTLARVQEKGGAAYIDVNVGRRLPAFMARLVKEIQSATIKPLSIDTPDPEIAEAGLAAYDPERAEGRKPILNSIAASRLEMLDLYKIRPFRPILMASEGQSGRGETFPCRTAAETLETARGLLRAALEACPGLGNEDCIIDPGIAPVGGDMEGITKRVLDSIAAIHGDPACAGVHISVGLSNFTVMLPSKRADGRPVKGPLESAFLTKAIPLGLDMIIGSVKRKYRLLDPDHDAMVCLEEFLALSGIDAVMRIREFYATGSQIETFRRKGRKQRP